MNKCPACDANASLNKIESTDAGMIMQCSICGLQFVTPVPDGVPVFVDFSDAARELFLELKAGRDLAPLLTPSEQMALDCIRRTCGPGDSVFEICFEAGRLLEAARRGGYNPCGVDPIPGHVSHMEKQGHAVSHGLLDGWRAEWPAPKAVIVLESLVRFPDPVVFLAKIRQKFPLALLFVSVPSPNRSLKAPGFDRRSDYPPHHLTRWSHQSLRIAMERAGYSCMIKTAFINANSLEVPGFVRALVRVAYRAIGEADYSYVAIGRPNL